MVLKGDTNIKYLQENGVKIWDEWADENGDLGPVYATNGAIGTVKKLPNYRINRNAKTNPNSRRMLVSAWNPSVLRILRFRLQKMLPMEKPLYLHVMPFFQFMWRMEN